jgi:hypothetical protein
MKKNVKEESLNRKVALPGECKRIAAMIGDRVLRRAYINAMIDAETTFQTMKRKQPKEKNDE